MQHTPVLLQEVITQLDPRPGQFVIDGTVDGGGHAEKIAVLITPKGILLGLDWDEALLEKCRQRLSGHENVTLVHGNYADLPEILREKRLNKADGLLIDLGFSSEQLESSGRGFSFAESSKDEPLLMTYDDSRRPVRDILRQESEESIADIIFTFGGERLSRRIAKAIKERGKKWPIMTSGDLAETVRSVAPGRYERGRIDPATRTFQAFRIYANGELANLTSLLGNLTEIVKPGGRVAIITFHSLEDGMVKREFQKLSKETKAIILTKKPIGPSFREKKENPRSRSAKLRALQII